jgi:hypothetical protein
VQRIAKGDRKSERGAAMTKEHDIDVTRPGGDKQAAEIEGQALKVRFATEGGPDTEGQGHKLPATDERAPDPENDDPKTRGEEPGKGDVEGQGLRRH